MFSILWSNFSNFLPFIAFRRVITASKELHLVKIGAEILMVVGQDLLYSNILGQVNYQFMLWDFSSTVRYHQIIIIWFTEYGSCISYAAVAFQNSGTRIPWREILSGLQLLDGLWLRLCRACALGKEPCAFEMIIIQRYSLFNITLYKLSDHFMDWLHLLVWYEVPAHIQGIQLSHLIVEFLASVLGIVHLLRQLQLLCHRILQRWSLDTALHEMRIVRML